MGLEVQGATIYSLGEWQRLVRSYTDQQQFIPATLAARYCGEQLHPLQILVALDVEARLLPGATNETHELLDIGLDRLRRALPGHCSDEDDASPS
jgi:hypothetical protein